MKLIDEVTVPTMTANSSYILSSFDENGSSHYETTSYYSPALKTLSRAMWSTVPPT